MLHSYTYYINHLLNHICHIAVRYGEVSINRDSRNYFCYRKKLYGYGQRGDRRGLGGDRRGPGGDWRGLCGDRRGLGGNRRGLGGDRHKLGGDRRGLGGDRRGLDGGRRGLGGDWRGLQRTGEYTRQETQRKYRSGI